MSPHFRRLSLLVGAALAASSIGYTGASETIVGQERRAQVEADWILQASLRRDQSTITTKDDALGACDGVKTGSWAFHTGLDNDPWWQVDLGDVYALARVVIYNRCDAADRARWLKLLVSEDGQTWREVYQHDGSVFYGATDNKPLIVQLDGVGARFVRVQLPGQAFLHLDEVEVYGVNEEDRNLALWGQADQSSISQWSVYHRRPDADILPTDVTAAIERGRELAADLRDMGIDVDQAVAQLDAIAKELQAAGEPAPPQLRRDLYLRTRWVVRRLSFKNPLLDFDQILFAKRVPSIYSHMSDQHYGWWSRPGGGLFILEGFREDAPRVRSITPPFPEGSFLQPDLSYDGSRVLFSWCRYYPHVSGLPDKLHKENLPEDAFYHVFEMNVDGTGVRQLTHGRYDDFGAKYLPNGDIVFLSTRRGRFIQCGKFSAMATLGADLPDCFVRCGGDPYRPVSVYTLHVMDREGNNLRAISPFENFEWNPSVTSDGRILYARWDYVDRNNMPYMSLWSVAPDGTNPRLVYGNFTTNPHCVFEARAIPGSHKIIFTASAHHCITGGSLVLLDPDREMEGEAALTRLTPEVCFPESEGWPLTYYASPYPLSERYYLTEWSHLPLQAQGGMNPVGATGLYLYDAFGNLELLYRDPAISSMYPIPLRPRPVPHRLPSAVDWDGPQEGRMLLLNVYDGLPGIPPGTIKRLRVVATPPKTQPEPNWPNLGVTGDDPGKCVLGTVPVEADGSAFFRLPSGVPVFFQALDAEGIAVQTMRSLTSVQPGQNFSCAGCHQPRTRAPRNGRPLAARRPPSRVKVGPEGSWPFRFDRLVQPVLDANCVRCHRPDSPHQAASRIDLTSGRSYETLLSYGTPSLRDHVRARYYEGRSVVGRGAAAESPLLALLRNPDGHHGVRLAGEDLERIITWIDLYGQRQGSFSEEQEQDLLRFRTQIAGLLEER